MASKGVKGNYKEKGTLYRLQGKNYEFIQNLHKAGEFETEVAVVRKAIKLMMERPEYQKYLPTGEESDEEE